VTGEVEEVVGVGSRLERDYQTVAFRVRVYVDIDRWVIEVLSDLPLHPPGVPIVC
jgi:hypothetical protein